jgi:hypothetical protein
VPFGRQFIQVLQDNTQQIFNALDRYSVRDPTIYLENRQIYLDTEDKKALAFPQTENITTFSRLFENKFTFGPADYAPLPNSTAISKRLIDGRHPAEQIYWYFRSAADTQTNRLWKFGNSTTDQTTTDQTATYYNNIKLTIAGKDREQYWSPQIWQDIEQHAKQERYSGRSIGSMNWSYGVTHALTQQPKEFAPTGTVNFTSADRPWIYVDLAAPQDESQTTSFTVVVDGYGAYAISDGRGGLLYAN